MDILVVIVVILLLSVITFFTYRMFFVVGNAVLQNAKKNIEEAKKYYEDVSIGGDISEFEKKQRVNIQYKSATGDSSNMKITIKGLTTRDNMGDEDTTIELLEFEGSEDEFATVMTKLGVS